jgi:tRNA (guanine37-N1)-methyltransferase
VANRLSRESGLLLICGRYEGVDERVAAHLADDEISIGSYVLSGGELAAAVVIDAVARLLPGVLGNESSAAFESFQETGHGEGLLDCPHWTRPWMEGPRSAFRRQPPGDPQVPEGRRD